MVNLYLVNDLTRRKKKIFQKLKGTKAFSELLRTFVSKSLSEELKRHHNMSEGAYWTRVSYCRW
jgi:hypothetical protein